MLLIWRGYGWLTPIIAFVAMIVTFIIISFTFEDYLAKDSDIPLAISIIVSSLLVGMFGLSVNKKLKRLIDPETGEEHITPSHALFFIPIQYWAIIMPLFLFSGKLISDGRKAENIYAIEHATVGDVYHINLTKIFEEESSDYKYSLMKLVTINPEWGHAFVIARAGYRKRRYVRELLRDGDDKKENFYFDSHHTYTVKELLELHDAGAIQQIDQTIADTD